MIETATPAWNHHTIETMGKDSDQSRDSNCHIVIRYPRKCQKVLIYLTEEVPQTELPKEAPKGGQIPVKIIARFPPRFREKYFLNGSGSGFIITTRLTEYFSDFFGFDCISCAIFAKTNPVFWERSERMD